MGEIRVVMLVSAVAVSVAFCFCQPNYELNVMDSAGNTAAKAKDSVSSAASEASKYATEKTSEAANKAYETVRDLKDVASDKMDHVIRMVGTNQGGETLEKGMKYGKGKAYDHATKEKAEDRLADDALPSGLNASVDVKDAVGKVGQERDDHLKVHKARDEMELDEAGRRVGEAFDSAKKGMSREAKARYESAKEKLSEATGAVGDKMRNDKAEL